MRFAQHSLRYLIYKYFHLNIVAIISHHILHDTALKYASLHYSAALLTQAAFVYKAIILTKFARVIEFLHWHQTKHYPLLPINMDFDKPHAPTLRRQCVAINPPTAPT